MTIGLVLTPPTKAFHILYVDGVAPRRDSLRVSSLKRAFSLRIVATREKLDEALDSGIDGNPWDVVILTDWVPYNRNHTLSTFDALVAAYNKGAFRGLVCAQEMVDLCKRWTIDLRKQGVPAIAVPYVRSNPSIHLVHDVNTPVEVV